MMRLEKMKHVTGRRWRQVAALASVGATFVIACAGSDIPPTTAELADDLETAYSGSSAGTGGRGGSAGAGNGGTDNEAGAAGNGDSGSSGAAGAGGGGDAGAAGAGGAAA